MTTRTENKLDGLGRITSESDDGVLYVDTGFGSNMQIVRLNAKFLDELKTTKIGCRAYAVIQSYLYLISECDPAIPGCDPDEDIRRIKALRTALKTKRPTPPNRPLTPTPRHAPNAPGTPDLPVETACEEAIQ